jgi:hypothetical protein
VDANTRTVKDVFTKDIRYVIPLYQRPYVWTQDGHWAPLWEDVVGIAERYMRAMDVEDADPATVEAETTPHFLGAIVLNELPFSSKDIEPRQVIDGQQRLTTLQLMLDAVQEVFERLDVGRPARLLRKLVLNDPDVVSAPDHEFKVWPTNIDRDAFRSAMDNDADPAAHQHQAIAKAHNYFKETAEAWLLEGNDLDRRVDGLSTALQSRLQLVVIELGGNDNPQVIFETLNARGTPLLASDLVKNHLLQAADARGLDVQKIYDQWWRPFDGDDWRREQQQGRLRRPRIDAFLDYWLELETGEIVLAHDVFPTFRTLLRSRPTKIEEVAYQIQAYSHVYDVITEGHHPTVGPFLRRWRTLEAQTVTPLLMWLLHHEGAMVPGQLSLATRAIESYLVRRMLTRGTTKDYNRLFMEAAKHVADGPVENAGTRLRRFLAEQTADSRAWPTDPEVAQAVVTSPVYRLLKRGRLRMILVAWEDHLRGAKTEEPFAPTSKVTIEHLLPQTWSASSWPLSAGSELATTQRRAGLLHTMGNLTLLNDKLNPAMSNGSWDEKRPELAKHSVLRLNHRILEDQRPWDDARILERSRAAARAIVELWPGPTPVDVDYSTLDLPSEDKESVSTELNSGPTTTTQLLLEQGLLEEGELLVWVRQQVGTVHEAYVESDGNYRTADGEVFPSPSGAGKHHAGHDVNGWRIWTIPRLGGISLDELRSEVDG